ncbi:alpha/beta-hydrolase [Tylopilus felleus]
MLRTSVLLAILNIFGRVVQAVGVAPTVTLDNATVTGVTSGSTKQFLGTVRRLIKHAEIGQTGDLRFRLPQPLPPYNTNFSAMEYDPSCPQQPLVQFWPINLPAETRNYLNLMDDTGPHAQPLTLNVIAAADTMLESKLPWILPSGFMFDVVEIVYDGHNTLVRLLSGMSLGVPAVYVSMISRQEAKDPGVGNICLHDQRLALHWVQKYISAFGGDPTKVIIWGDSSAVICITLHMVTNGGDSEGLFRAAIMQGGGPVPIDDITHGQPYYDALVAETGCSGANDTLQCLREVPYDTLLNAVGQSPGPLAYQSLRVAWMPRVDGIFFTESPMHLVQQGVVADVPFISGNCDDEGTIFSLTNVNVTTDAELAEYFKTYYLPNASNETIEQVMKNYPSDPTKGSPFDTGHFNTLTPQFKLRLRRMHIPGYKTVLRSGKQNIWTYLSQRKKAVPFIGSYHASDWAGVYGFLNMTSYLVYFIANLEPNIGESTDQLIKRCWSC